MSKKTLTIEERATIYAAWKALETFAKDASGTCELPPDTDMQVGGNSITITIPDGWAVERAAGEDGDGNVKKAATQNTYGFSIFLALLERAQRFNQANVVLNLIVGAIEDALVNRCPTEESMRKQHPELMQQLMQQVEDIRKRMPMRNEPTRRLIRKPKKGRATVLVNKKPKQQAA